MITQNDGFQFLFCFFQQKLDNYKNCNAELKSIEDIKTRNWATEHAHTHGWSSRKIFVTSPSWVLLFSLKSFLGNPGKYTVKISDLEKAFTKKRTVSLSGKVWHLISPWIPLGRLFPANTIDRKMPEVSDKAAAELKDLVKFAWFRCCLDDR